MIRTLYHRLMIIIMYQCICTWIILYLIPFVNFFHYSFASKFQQLDESYLQGQDWIYIPSIRNSLGLCNKSARLSKVLLDLSLPELFELLSHFWEFFKNFSILVEDKNLRLMYKVMLICFSLISSNLFYIPFWHFS